MGNLPFTIEQKIIAKLCSMSELDKKTFALVLLCDCKFDKQELVDALQSLDKHSFRTFDKLQEIYATHVVAKEDEIKKLSEIVDLFGDFIKTKNRQLKGKL